MASEAERDDVIESIRRASRSVVIFGAGGGGRKVYRRLESLGVMVQAFVDNGVAKPGTELFGVPVFPWDGGSHCRDAFTVVASAAGAKEISRQLQDAGLLEGSDFVSYF